MSASAKKKLRKEETAAQLTEKQLNAQKEAKKLKIQTTIFVVVIVAVLLAGLVFAGTNFYKNSGIKQKNTIAAVIGDNEINSVDMNYYFYDLINATYSNWNSTYGDSTSLYLSLMGLDLTQPLSAQYYTEDTTWADYFVDVAMSAIQNDYLLSEKAAAEGYTLSEESRANLEDTINSLSLYASLYGYSDVDSYMRAVYGAGANVESYRVYAERSVLASEYYNTYVESLVFDDASIRAYEADKYDEFSSYSYANYTISYTDYLTGGTEDAEGNVTYSNEEKDAAREAAKAAAESLPVCSTVDELNAAIAALATDEETVNECSVFENVAYTSLSSSVQDWMADSSRKEGDFIVTENQATTTDDNGVETTAISSYTAYVFIGRNDNTEPLGNVRHILVNFEGGITDENGVTTYSDEEKAAAYEEAESILEQFKTGAQDENAFVELVSTYTDDTASVENGGLYEDIAPVQGVYVESFTNWATDPDRVAGDTGIIESTYGYHVMYYVGDDEMTYRDSMIHEQLVTETVNAWYTEILASAQVVEKDTSLLNKDIILNQAN